MEDYKEKYPVGTKVRLEGDYSDDEPHEVEGYRTMFGHNYLVFADGHMALVERVQE